MIDKTLEYYKNNAENYSTSTLKVNLNEIQNRFLSYLKKGDKILDFGCGSGRDTIYFLSKGYRVEAVDGSAELCSIASKNTGMAVKQMLFQELSAEDFYDGIWACSSILHLTLDELEEVMRRINIALVQNGVLYTSFKYGDFQGFRNERYFTDMTEERIKELLNKVQGFKVEELWISCDVIPGRGEEKWLNVILKKICF